MIKKLLILPSDHRSSLARDLLKVTGKLNRRQTKQFKKLKDIIYQGFVQVVNLYDDRSSFGVLIDEEFGFDIIKKADRFGVVVAVPVEASGQPGFKFDYGEDFGKHIKKVDPDYVKVLIRYNPLNKGVNSGQLKKLKRLNDFCQENNYQMLLELLVPPAGEDINVAGSEENYDKKLRLMRTLQAIKEISKVIKVDIWKLEWFSKAGWNQISRAIDDNAQMIILGRGGNKQQVKKWLVDAAGCKKVIGFAIGRTIFLKALEDYQAKKISKNQAVDMIANNFNFFVKIWNKTRK